MKKLLTLVISGFLAAPLFAGEIRTWTSAKDPSKQLQAELVRMEAGNLVLKKPDGKLIKVPPTAFTEADQRYVAKNAPPDAMTAAADIDRLIMEKLKTSYQSIVADLKKAKDKPVDVDYTVKDKVKRVEELTFLKEMTYKQLDDPLTNEQFVRRIYLDIAGRIPTHDEAVSFLSKAPRSGPALKAYRSQLINKLLDSDAFSSNFFNYLSDVLRIRDGISMNRIRGIRTAAYADWTKDQITQNTPWDKWVREMLTAEGHYWDNPASGFMMTDMGMQLCNVSNIFTVFTGTEITCAQCHDHPFEEVMQMDFYRMGAFTSGLDFRMANDTTAPKSKVVRGKLKEYQAEWKRRNAKEERPPRFDRGLQDLMGSYSYYMGDKDDKEMTGGRTMMASIKLPHDYKYDDADPHETVYPQTYFGNMVELEDHESARDGFAQWMTSKEHPRFTINIVNRLWGRVFGLAQIEPTHDIPGHLDGQAQNAKLLKYLEGMMKTLNYDMKGYLRALYNTNAYQREANHYSPTLSQIDKGEYHFPAPVLRRMSAEQMWDSMVALTTDKPEKAKNRVLEEYQALMNGAEWNGMDLDAALKFKGRYNNLGGISMGMDDMMMEGGGGRGNRIDPLHIRASEMGLPSGVGSLMFKFGQSDKQLIENSNKVGSVPQVMFMLNGDMTNKTMVRSDSIVIKNAKAAGSQTDGINSVFMSVLSRKPNSDELQTAKKLVREEDYTDLVWALLNTREFMFIQ